MEKIGNLKGVMNMYNKDRRAKRHYRKQRRIGFILLLTSAISIFIDGDATWAVIGIPLGLYTIFTKNLIVESVYKDHFEDDDKDE